MAGFYVGRLMSPPIYGRFRAPARGRGCDKGGVVLRDAWAPRRRYPPTRSRNSARPPTGPDALRIRDPGRRRRGGRISVGRTQPPWPVRADGWPPGERGTGAANSPTRR